MLRRMRLVMLVTLCLAAGALGKPVPELVRLVPAATEYELIYQFNPMEVWSKGYEVDNGDAFLGQLRRIGFLLILTDFQGRTSWAFASMDAYSQNLNDVGIPNHGAGIIQRYVDNLEVFSNVPGIKQGRFPKGNVEIWPNYYWGGNSQNIPGARNACDWGDTPYPASDEVEGRGCMQIHNYLNQQTVLAFNDPLMGKNCDLGIGNCPRGNPDWTQSKSARNYQDARLLVVGTFDNLKRRNVVKLDERTLTYEVASEKINYQRGETMKFQFTFDLGGQPAPTLPHYLRWERKGDDGKVFKRYEPIHFGKTQTIDVTLDKPGFVMITAWLVDHHRRRVARKFRFDGGVGMQMEALRPAMEEPKDFDAFWQRQKRRLANVPMTVRRELVKKQGAWQVFAVSVDCAGPRPVTGYLTVPVGASPKSLPVTVWYDGYGFGVPKLPTQGRADRIDFRVNAHGYELGRDRAYYREFGKSLQKKGMYAFSKEENADPETAYFNGMALRVMRSLQYVKTLPEWNGKRLEVRGGSQGGMQTVWAAALDSQVTHAYPFIVWCCDLAGTTVGRPKGWRPAYVPGLAYYDSVFHGRRIRCHIDITRAGLGDSVCPPSGLAILYHDIPSAHKKITFVQGSTHGGVPAHAQSLTLKNY